ncbi:uncharacterized protein LTR77_005889 [Saxophila tyrrhenica]|uniref:F-box domain-containing protein n=1 Tax=Saxophila tyrrhenica TaxID=1690608 RepID=A0AAV9PC05_9PEZI|nr:hypothetical protein LTR77_005889 [Saxophila tyrrhenica]
MANIDELPPTLLDVLANTVVLGQLSPYINIRDLLSLSATCSAARNTIYCNREAWRHLDLTGIKSAMIDSSPIDIGGMAWRAERMDEALTSDDFFSGPLYDRDPFLNSIAYADLNVRLSYRRGIFGRLHRKSVLQHVHTLVLDGLSVPADVIHEIVCEDRYNVRILSLRQCRHLNETKLQQVLRYITRPTRPDGTPKLRALYFFGSKDDLGAVTGRQQHHQILPANAGITDIQGAQLGASSQLPVVAHDAKVVDDEARWYGSSGRIMKPPLSGWAETMQSCKGLIAFDAILCRGPRHDITKVDSETFLQPTVANIALGRGCETCGTIPEGPAVFGTSPAHALPLLSPVPTHSSTLRAAQMPSTASNGLHQLYARCEDCLRGRYCERCLRFWCEDCLPSVGGANGSPVKVYSRLCVEHCLVSEMMSGAGSQGMWG